MKERTHDEQIEWYRNWALADLDYLLRPNGQSRLDDFVDDCLVKYPGSSAPIVAECHRRLGKSFHILKRFIEVCLTKPRAICKVGAPSYLMVKEIIEPNLDDLLQDCPPEFKPRKSGYTYYWNNPAWESDEESMLKLVGCDYKRGDRLRGTNADAIALDEAGYIENLEYILKNVLAQQFDRTDEPLFIIVSTPPDTMAHDFTKPGGVVEKAIRDGRHIVIPGSKNADFTDKEKRKVIEIIGGDETSIAYQREIECLHISDEERLVIPEYTNKKEVIEDWPGRPEYFIPWISMDTGWTDYTAVLFSFVHFDKQLVCVEDMIWTHYKSLGDLSALIKDKKEELYADGPPVWNAPMIQGVRQVADCTELEIETLATDFELYFEQVDKYDIKAAIANYRTTIQQGAIRFHPENCKPLIYQNENAIWNEARTDFARNKTLGHCDALIAAVYLNRMAILDENPYPDKPYKKDSSFVLDTPERRETVEGVLSALGKRDKK